MSAGILLVSYKKKEMELTFTAKNNGRYVQLASI